MARFSDLPNEILLQILSWLPPPDLGSFYCIDKSIYTLTAVHRIHYLRLKTDYATRCNTDTPAATVRFFKSIIGDPEAALYVQHWTIDGSRWQWRFYGNDPVQYTQADLTLFKETFDSSKWLLDKDKIECIEAAKNGNEEPLMAISLTPLHNLTSLEINYGGAERRIFLKIIKRFTSAAAKKTCSEWPLSNLVSVNLGPREVSFEGDCMDVAYIEAFARLPSVRIINANCIQGDLNMVNPFQSGVRSKLTDLNISQGDISPHRFLSLVEGFKSLQSFTYWPTYEDNAAYDFDPFFIVRGLRICASNTLRELRVRTNGISSSYVGSLRAFKKLEVLDVDIRLLVGLHPSSDIDLGAALPSSIREVKLCREEDCTMFSSTLTTLVERLLTSKADPTADRHLSLAQVEFLCSSLPIAEEDRLKAVAEKGQIRFMVLRRVALSFPVYSRRRGHYAQRKLKPGAFEDEMAWIRSP